MCGVNLELKEKRKLINDVLKEFKNNKVPTLTSCSGTKKLVENRKKLYKYYSLDSSNTWSNLINNEVYFSDPISFNDPFDCNMGISDDELLKSVIALAVTKSNAEILFDQAIALLEFFQKDPDVEFDGETEFLEVAESFQQLMIAIKKIEKDNASNEIKAIKVMESTPEFLLDLCSYATNLKVDTKILENSFIGSSLAQIMNFFSLKTIEEKEDIISKITNILKSDKTYTDKIFCLCKLWDPELALIKEQEFKEKIQDISKQLHNYIGTIFGVSSFAERPDNILMWSHYANKHTGICVEYDFSHLDKEDITAFLLPVIYTKKRPLLPIKKLTNLFGKEDDNVSISNGLYIMRYLLEAILSKSLDWKYEEEWRMIGMKGLTANHLLELPIITKIIIGVNTSDKNKEAILKFAEERKIPVVISEIKSDEYVLNA